MAAGVIEPAAERAQPRDVLAPGAHDCWSIAWDGDAGYGFARLALVPSERRVWFWWYAAGPEIDGLVCVRDHEVALPAEPASLDLRADGLWTSWVCETPFDHWSIGLEAFGLGVDDGWDLRGGEWGDRVPFGADVEFEASAAPSSDADANGFVQTGRLIGELLVGADVIALDARCVRRRRWARPTWGTAGVDLVADPDDARPAQVRVGGTALAIGDGAADVCAVVLDDSHDLVRIRVPAGADGAYVQEEPFVDVVVPRRAR